MSTMEEVTDLEAQGSMLDHEPTTTTLSNVDKNKKNADSPAFSEHLGSSRQYLRDMILGVNDGIVSTFLLVAGVAGGGLKSSDILLTGIAGAIAGAVSMGAGEYVATKSQNELMRGEIKLETQHIEKFLDDELLELETLLEVIGVPKEEDDVRQVMRDYYRNHPDMLVKIMIALEFGVIDLEVRNPFKACFFSCFLFIAGALPSIIPFIFSGDKPFKGLIVAAVLTTAALVIVGSVKSWAARGNCLIAALENLVIAGFGGGLAYGVGLLFESLVNSSQTN